VALTTVRLEPRRILPARCHGDRLLTRCDGRAVPINIGRRRYEPPVRQKRLNEGWNFREIW
jgi:hypothetical protein